MRAILDVFHLFNVGVEVPGEVLARAFESILRHEDPSQRDVFMGSFLTAVMMRSPSVEQVAALISAAFRLDGYDPRRRPTMRVPRGKRLIGVAGSGKKGVKSLNISTAGSILAAAMGAFVAKCGSFSTSSLTGSADFMSEVGYDLQQSTDVAARTLYDTGLAFFSIENIIPRFDQVYGNRFHSLQALSFGLAALLCPVQVDTLIYGLAHPRVELSAGVLRHFGRESAQVVTSTHDGIHHIDEVGVFGRCSMVQVRGGEVAAPVSFGPVARFGLPAYRPEDIAQAADRQRNIQCVLAALGGKGSAAHRDIIAVNAANILWQAGLCEDLGEGYARSRRALERGTAIEKLEHVVAASNGSVVTLRRHLDAA